MCALVRNDTVVGALVRRFALPYNLQFELLFIFRNTAGKKSSILVEENIYTGGTTMKRKSILILLISALLLTACAPAASAPQETGGLLASPRYPEMAPYPDEMSYFDDKTGEFDDEGFDAVYSAWTKDRHDQYDQPAGYADGLEVFFQTGIPEFLAGDPGENAVCSPLNLYMALALLAEVTEGDTRQQILDLLNSSGIEKLRTQAGHVWNAHYCADGASACTLANSVWMDSLLTYDGTVLDTLTKNYYASAFQGDLGSPEMDALLQEWLNEQTGGLLKDQIQNVHMDPATVLALASTIYYRAKWTNEFGEGANTEDVFHGTAGDVTATYMNTTLSYGPYYWGEDFGAVSLGLEDGSQMWLVLPDEGKTPEYILASGHALELILGNHYESENQKSLRVNLSLPKFDIVADRKLNNALKALGITDVFVPADAEFSLLQTEDDCWLDSVDHAARVAIDEEGVTAAAYTVMLMCGAGMPSADEMDFILDRPFLFVITSRDNLPLFAGTVNQV